MDALVARKVMGLDPLTVDGDMQVFTWRREFLMAGDRFVVTDNGSESLPHYSTDIAAAWQVVEKMAEGGLRLSLDRFGGDPWWAEFADEGWEQGAQATSATAPMAICLAALKAKGVEVPTVSLPSASS